MLHSNRTQSSSLVGLLETCCQIFFYNFQIYDNLSPKKENSDHAICQSVLCVAGLLRKPQPIMVDNIASYAGHSSGKRMRGEIFNSARVKETVGRMHSLTKSVFGANTSIGSGELHEKGSQWGRWEK